MQLLFYLTQNPGGSLDGHTMKLKESVLYILCTGIVVLYVLFNSKSSWNQTSVTNKFVPFMINVCKFNKGKSNNMKYSTCRTKEIWEKSPGQRLISLISYIDLAIVMPQKCQAYDKENCMDF